MADPELGIKSYRVDEQGERAEKIAQILKSKTKEVEDELNGLISEITSNE